MSAVLVSMWGSLIEFMSLEIRTSCVLPLTDFRKHLQKMQSMSLVGTLADWCNLARKTVFLLCDILNA